MQSRIYFSEWGEAFLRRCFTGAGFPRHGIAGRNIYSYSSKGILIVQTRRNFSTSQCQQYERASPRDPPQSSGQKDGDLGSRHVHKPQLNKYGGDNRDNFTHDVAFRGRQVHTRKDEQSKETSRQSQLQVYSGVRYAEKRTVRIKQHNADNNLAIGEEESVGSGRVSSRLSNSEPPSTTVINEVLNTARSSNRKHRLTPPEFLARWLDTRETWERSFSYELYRERNKYSSALPTILVDYLYQSERSKMVWM